MGHREFIFYGLDLPDHRMWIPDAVQRAATGNIRHAESDARVTTCLTNDNCDTSFYRPRRMLIYPYPIRCLSNSYMRLRMRMPMSRLLPLALSVGLFPLPRFSPPGGLDRQPPRWPF